MRVIQDSLSSLLALYCGHLVLFTFIVFCYYCDYLIVPFSWFFIIADSKKCVICIYILKVTYKQIQIQTNQLKELLLKCSAL